MSENKQEEPVSVDEQLKQIIEERKAEQESFQSQISALTQQINSLKQEARTKDVEYSWSKLDINTELSPNLLNLAKKQIVSKLSEVEEEKMFEFIEQEAKSMGIISTKTTIPNPVDVNPQAPKFTTQDEAFKYISNQLKNEGFRLGTPEFTERVSEFWKENQINKL